MNADAIDGGRHQAAALADSCWQALDSGRAEDAVRLGRIAASLNPRSPHVARAFGFALWAAGQHGEALDAMELAASPFEEALEESPARTRNFERPGLPQCAVAEADWHFWSDLGMLRLEAGRLAQAAAAFGHCIRLEPNQPSAYRGKAEALSRLNRLDEADAACRAFVELGGQPGPGFAATVARVRLGQQDWQAAADIATTFLAGSPDDSTLLILRATAYDRLRLYAHAVSDLERADALTDGDFRIVASLAIARWSAGDVEAAREDWERALELTPTDADLQATLLWLGLHFPRVSAQRLRALHEQTVEHRTGIPPNTAPFSNLPEPERPLRVGYISGQFKMDPAICFLGCWLRHLDPSRAYFYSTQPNTDHGVAAYRGMTDHWRDVWTLDDQALASLIRDDGIDVLVDLTGHFLGHRLELLALRPAPVQVAFHHYPGTTGSTAFDYFMSDHWMSPDGSNDEYTEPLYRLPSGLLAFQLACDPPPVTASPFDTNGFVTFGLFQRPGKYHREIWDMVAAILANVPESRLLIHDGTSGLDDDQSGVRPRLLGYLTDRGVDESRVIFAGRRPLAEHLRIVAEADIALDSFPYNGQTTACDCLWMGVPMVNLRGSTHAGRVGQALLARVGLRYLSVDTPEEYVAAAVRLAREPRHLRELRRKLRSRCEASLGQTKQLAVEIEEGLRSMWREWCQSATR